MYVRHNRSMLVVGLVVLVGLLWGSERRGNERWGNEPIHTSLGQIVGVQAPQLLATRYYARNRTTNFFQRSANHSPRKTVSTQR